MKNKDNKQKIPPIREGKKRLDFDTIMNAESPTFGELISLINSYPKKTKVVVEKILSLEPSLEEITILYNKITNSGLKEKIYETFHNYVKDRCERHVGGDEDFFFLVDSVLIENRNSFYADINVREFIDNILLQWQRSPSSYKTLNYLFETLFGGWALKFYKEMLKHPELYNTSLIFTDCNIKEIFRNASFGITFPGRTPEVRENLRKYYLAEIFERLVDCIKKIPLQIGNSECCCEITKESLDEISLVKKYADMLYTISAIPQSIKHDRVLALDSKKEAILSNAKKWKKKVTKWVTFFSNKKMIIF